MADSDSYVPNAYPGVVHFGGERDRHRGLEGKDAVLIASGQDANRDVMDAGRDLTSAGFDAGRDLVNANADANRDLINANADAQRDLADAQRDFDAALHNADAHRDIIEQVSQVETTTVSQAKDNVIRTLEQGAMGRETTLAGFKDQIRETIDQASRGRETTLATSAQIREDLADAKSELLLAHCETQKLVIKEHCETREAVREEGVRTRETVITEARAVLERELAAKSEENTLLKLQINLLSSGTGPLSARS